MIKLFLFDIEGTTTDINFVHKVLFPYSVKKMDEYMLAHYKDPQLQSTIDLVQKTVMQEDNKKIELKEVISTLLLWIHQDRKHPALKEIQGNIWNIGYSQNDFKGHVYPDVLPFFQKIQEKGMHIGIYSSGSVHAQKLLFSHSINGDLTPMISHYFDTMVGGKREKSSYEKIAKAVNLNPNEIHFFSDIPEELKAASEAKLQVSHVTRPGTNSSNFNMITDFNFFDI